MLQVSSSRIALVIAVCLLGLAFNLPNVATSDFAARLPSWMKPLQLGLDLRGGSYLLLEVDTDAVFKEQLSNMEETVRSVLRTPRIGFRNLRSADSSVYVTITDESEVTKARVELTKNFADLEVTAEEGGRIKITVPENQIRERQISAVNQSIEIVRRRVDEFGTSEPSIQREGTNRIIVELPGVDSPERIKALIGQTAKLNFHLLEPGTISLAGPAGLPPGTMLLPGQADDPRMYVVRRRVEVSGDRLIDAQPTFQDGNPVVNFRFDTAGGRRFGQVSTANVGNSLAIVLDGRVISAPTIQSPIVGGSGIITGGFTVEAAQDLALLLRAGALPAPLLVLEERTVGPSLGADSIADGTTASIIGLILVAIFMVLAYFTFGWFACVALAFNMILLFAILSLLGATLTLPGIAGMVLTLGMAVDANVLIYERMREEFASGRTLLNALGSGYNQAFRTILDSNLTGLIAGGLLFYLGSGPVRGFAVTMTIGIATSMFTAVMVTRLLVWLWFRSGKRQTLPI